MYSQVRTLGKRFRPHWNITHFIPPANNEDSVCSCPTPDEERKAVSTPDEERKAVHTRDEERKAVPTPDEERKAVPTPDEERKAVPTPDEDRKAVPTPDEERKAVPTPDEERKAVPTCSLVPVELGSCSQTPEDSRATSGSSTPLFLGPPLFTVPGLSAVFASPFAMRRSTQEIFSSPRGSASVGSVSRFCSAGWRNSARLSTTPLTIAPLSVDVSLRNSLGPLNMNAAPLNVAPLNIAPLNIARLTITPLSVDVFV